MGTLKQWLGWILFLGIFPTIAFLVFARHMREHEVAYYLMGVPPLLAYFYIMGRLGLDVPGTMSEAGPDDVAYSILTFNISRRQLAGKVILWIRTVVIVIGMPALGAGLIFYGVRDGETMGYFLGPAMIWVSGGLWAMGVQFFVRRARLREQAAEASQDAPPPQEQIS